MALCNEELLSSPTTLPVIAWRRISSPEPLLKKARVSLSAREVYEGSYQLIAEEWSAQIPAPGIAVSPIRPESFP